MNNNQQKYEKKNYQPKAFWLFRWFLLIAIPVGIICDLLARYNTNIHQYIYSQNFVSLVDLCDKTIFSNKTTTIVSVCTSIGSITFSIFSYAKTHLSSSQKEHLVNKGFLDILNIKAVYNPYVFVSIAFQCVGLLMGWGTLFYLMVIYQIVSFSICVSNYLKMIDDDKLKATINRKVKKLDETDDSILDLLLQVVLRAFEEKTYYIEYSLNVFRKFDEYLSYIFEKNYEDSKKNKDMKVNEIEVHYSTANGVLDRLVGSIENTDKKYEVFYTLLIVIAPNNIYNNLECFDSSMSFFKTSADFKQYLVFYYIMLFRVVDYNPALLQNIEFLNILKKNAEICYSIIVYLQFKYLNNSFSKEDNDIMTKAKSVVRDNHPIFCFDSQKLVIDILCKIWFVLNKESGNSDTGYTLGVIHERIESIFNRLNNSRNTGSIFIF